MKQIAIVGAGRWANAMHLPAILKAQKESLIEVTAICDRDSAVAESFAKNCACLNVFDDFDVMVAKQKFDGIVILLRPELIPEYISKCIRLNIPFLCEKPPSPSTEIHKKLLGAIGDLPHLVGYNRRFSPYMQKAKEWLEGTIPLVINCDFLRVNRTQEDFSTTFVHGLDAILHLANQSVKSLAAEIDYLDGYQNIFVRLEFQNGLRGNMQILPNNGFAKEHYSIYGKEASVEIAFAQNHMIDLPGYVELQFKNKIQKHLCAYDFDAKSQDIWHLGGFYDEYCSFSKMLNGQEHVVSNLQTTFLTQMLREKIMDAVKQKKKSFYCEI